MEPQNITWGLKSVCASGDLSTQEPIRLRGRGPAYIVAPHTLLGVQASFLPPLCTGPRTGVETIENIIWNTITALCRKPEVSCFQPYKVRACPSSPSSALASSVLVLPGVPDAREPLPHTTC